MTKLSVNINKLATLRNSRGGNNPDIKKSAQDCEQFGAQGITVHPRPDERHITKSDVYTLSEVLTTEFNIEGYPDRRFIEMVKDVKPAQATLVPDPPDALTSNAGWDTITHNEMLKKTIAELKSFGVRVSVFVGTELKMIDGAQLAGADRIELYTEPYAKEFGANQESAVHPFKTAAKHAMDLGLKINAGHDLDRNNLKFFKESIPYLSEVSIGHALICDALYMGLENTIQIYRRLLED